MRLRVTGAVSCSWDCIFLLDSQHPSSLTLRDYSKVVNRSNHRMRQKPPPRDGGAMPSLRARYSVIALLLVFSLCIPTFLFAQGTSGRIVGRVSDSSGAVLADVKVTLVNEATNVSRDMVTSANGD